MTVSLSTLLRSETIATIYATALDVATALGLPVTAWLPGDPTRSLYHVVSEQLGAVEDLVAAYIAAGFLDYAEGDWRTLCAEQVFGVERIAATYAGTVVRLTNGAGGLYVIAAGDVTLKSSTSNATYRNTSGGTLASGPGTFLDVDVVADVAGSGGSAAATEIDTIVTTMLGVTCSNAAAAVGVDEESDDALAVRCRAKLGSLSPDGPADAYSYVALTPALAGTSAITRVRTVADSATGDVAVYLAGPAGAVAGGDVTLATAGIAEWATPLCVTPTVSSAAAVVVAVTYQLWLYASVGKTTAEVQAAVAAALLDMFRARPIGGDVVSAPPGAIYHSMIESTIRSVYPEHAFRVSVTTPASDTSLTISQVATLGTVTSTITFVNDP